MTGSELEETARAVRASGDEQLLDRICDATQSYREGLGGGPEKFRGGVKMQRNTGTDRLVRQRLVKHLRGHMIATAYGFSVSTRLIVMRAQGR